MHHNQTAGNGGGDHNHNQKKTKGYVGTAEQLEFSSETTGGEQVVEQQCLSAERKKKKIVILESYIVREYPSGMKVKCKPSQVSEK